MWLLFAGVVQIHSPRPFSSHCIFKYLIRFIIGPITQSFGFLSEKAFKLLS